MVTPYTVQFILTEAIFESLQDRQFFAPIQGAYQEVALNKLGGLFDEWRDKIPYAQEITFPNVAALASTSFVSVDNVNYILPPNVLVTLRRVGKDEFYRLSSIIGLNSLPAIYYFDELTQNINVYPVPTAPSYQFVVWARPQMIALNPTDPLPSNLPRYMVDALIYELASRLCATYGVPWTPDKDRIRQNLSRLVDSKKTVDLKATVKTVFKRPNPRIPPYPYLYHMITGT